MSRASVFAITTPTNSVRLDGRRKAEVAFTVYNASGRNLRARAQIAAQQPAAAGWLTLSETAERPLPIAGAAQYTVTINVPPTATPGSYTFRLSVVGEENPDEQYAEGPTVTFEIPQPIGKKRRFPWWVVAVEAVAIVMVLVSVFLLLPKSVTVPPVANLSVAEATQELRDAGLAVNESIVLQSSNSVARGSVIQTDPPDGERAGKGATVTLIVSTGP